MAVIAGKDGRTRSGETSAGNSKARPSKSEQTVKETTGSPARRKSATATKGTASTSATPVSTSNDTARVRKALGVTRAIFARMVGFSERAVASWELDGVVSAAGMRRVKEMDRLREALSEVMRAEFIPEWLTNPCEELDGLKPIEVLERGEADRLWRVVWLLGSGMPT